MTLNLIPTVPFPTTKQHAVSGADSIGHGGDTCLPLLQMAGHGNTVNWRTANKKLTKLYWPSRKRSPKRLIVLLEPKSGGARPKKFFSGAWLRTGAPRFQIRSGATARSGKNSTKCSHLFWESWEIHTRLCCCTVRTTCRCNCHAAWLCL